MKGSGGISISAYGAQMSAEERISNKTEAWALCKTASSLKIHRTQKKCKSWDENNLEGLMAQYG